MKNIIFLNLICKLIYIVIASKDGDPFTIMGWAASIIWTLNCLKLL